MKKISLLGLALVAGLSFQACTSSTSEDTETTEDIAVAVLDGTINADLSASSVEWKGVMLGIKEHTGTVTLTAADVTVANGAVTGGSFTVDMSSIAPTDTAYDAESTPQKLVGHLSSADFFNVEEFPSASFEITSTDGDNLIGNLTVRGVTNEETVTDVVVTADAVSGTLTFDRKKYDVSFDVPMKEMVISNDIELLISIVAAH